MKNFVFKVFFLFSALQPLYSQNVRVLYLKDSNSNFNIDSLEAKSKIFKVFENSRLSYGHENKPHWIKISISNNDTLSQKKLVAIEYAFLEEVNIFLVKNGKVIFSSDTVGWKYPYKNRVFKHYFPVFPITIDAKSSLTIYCRIFRRYISVIPPIKFWDEGDFYQNEINLKFIWGGFGGILLLASTFGLILFLVLGKRLYLLYGLYVLMALLYTLIDKGFFFEYYNDGFLLSAASKNDKDFLGQLNPLKGEIYVFDKGYVNYKYYYDWKKTGVFFVTRLNENASYHIIESKEILARDVEIDGVLKDEIVILKTEKEPLRVRLITFKSLTTSKSYTFISNLFDVAATTIAKLYKNRWEIEPFFKQLKQNFELKGFYSDSKEGV